MVNQVQVVAILMIVQGSLTSLMGLICSALGPAMLALFSLEDPELLDPEDEIAMTLIPAFYLVIGVLVLIAGVLNVIAGIRCLKFRGRTFALVALFCNIIPFFTVYCTPTSIAVMVYGLIVLFQQDVARAFQMAASGMPADEVQEQFGARRRGPARPDWHDS